MSLNCTQLIMVLIQDVNNDCRSTVTVMFCCRRRELTCWLLWCLMCVEWRSRSCRWLFVSVLSRCPTTSGFGQWVIAAYIPQTTAISMRPWNMSESQYCCILLLLVMLALLVILALWLCWLGDWGASDLYKILAPKVWKVCIWEIWPYLD